MRNTYMAKPEQVQRRWFVVDAEGQTWAGLLRSRFHTSRQAQAHLYPTRRYWDHVIVINASKVVVTGKKAQKQAYYRHTGYPGGLRAETFAELMQKPEQAVYRAVVCSP